MKLIEDYIYDELSKQMQTRIIEDMIEAFDPTYPPDFVGDAVIGFFNKDRYELD